MVHQQLRRIPPWEIHLHDTVVIDKITHRKFMERPEQFKSDQWELVLALCNFEPSKLLSLSDAIQKLQDLEVDTRWEQECN
ncbi:TKL protein kinase [Phytophthora megakarya]|uniref:TKL protein kinase n=1 Tax=Phytophthora megakarya TaxID=4795 RepID=A0A225X4U1_9STRA|nr:TKL protein kinase [Phytophthora megakarya]